MDIHNITLRAISQATESEDRVRTALSLFISGEQIETINIEGHFGNPISILQARIKGKDCSRLIELIGSKLSESELIRLKHEVGGRVDDDCILHIRFDKQAAYKGTMQLASTKDAISVGIKLKAYPARQENAIATAEKIFSNIGN